MSGWTLEYDNSLEPKLTLTRPDNVSLTIDFTSGKARHRTTESGHGAQALTKALGVKHYLTATGEYPHIIDATGGLGQDAWALASMGCKISLIERNSVVHAMLNDALQRALNEAHTASIADRIRLINNDATAVMADLCTRATHAVYLDPMYPMRKKKANSKKGMQFLHALVEPPDSHDDSLLISALQNGVSRVVVKRPKGAPLLHGSDRFSGQRTCLNTPNTRYDIYHCQTESLVD